MPRKPRQDAEAIGSDSFLDVVTNIVGILIILVMVVGIRVKNAPLPETNEADGAERVRQLAGEAEALERDVLRLESMVRQVTLSGQAKFQERAVLAYALAENQRELDEAKKTLGVENQASFEVRRAVAAAEMDLSKLNAAKAEAAKPKKRKPIQIRNYPTPISKTVFGGEAHFQLKHGRLAWVPFNELVAMCGHDAQPQLHLLQQGSEIDGVVGPRQGFEAHYLMEPVQIPGGRLGANEMVELVPISEDLGELTSDALASPSQFRMRLDDYPPRESTVTIWVYGDSFEEYTQIKEALYSMGYRVAARPMPDDVYIGGSNHGSHSAAQ